MINPYGFEGETAVFDRAAVVAPHIAATEAGRAVLTEGGNAIEAMIAMAATISVVYPHMNAIGGDGFWLVRTADGVIRYIEACGFAGARATLAFYRDKGFEKIPARGPLAALTVPGTIGGWALAHELARSLGAKLPLRDLLADATRRAAEGTPVSRSEAGGAPNEFEALKTAPGFAKTYLSDGALPKEGSVRKMPALAATFEQLAHAGLDDFYRGDVGREIASDLDRVESPVTRDDLRNYRAVLREPLRIDLPGRIHANAAPPTQGLAALLILGMFEELGAPSDESFAHIHALVECSKRALKIRDEVCTDFEVLKHRLPDVLSKRNIAREAAMISLDRAAPLPLPEAAGDTVWMGATDASGLTVSFIQSVYWEYGSGCVLPATGITMQNRGASFSLDPAAVNPLAPGRRPFHTLNPPIAAFDDGRVLAYGSMGGDGQPQFQAQLFSRIMAGMDVAAACDAPRFLYGRTWGSMSTSLKLENRFDPSLIAKLRAVGHDVDVSPHGWHEGFGHAGAILRRADGRVFAAHDPRSDGGAAGV